MASFITVTQAVERADEQGFIVTEDQVRYAASKGMGRKVFGRWHIYDDKFERVLSGDPVERVGIA